MAKLNKMYYYTAKKEKKLNCYYITIPKDMINNTDLENAELNIKIVNNTIIIDKK